MLQALHEVLEIFHSCSKRRQVFGTAGQDEILMIESFHALLQHLEFSFACRCVSSDEQRSLTY